MSSLSESIIDKLSIDYLRNQVLSDYLRNQVLKNAYGNDDTFIASLDPRTLLLWYLFFGIVPWFIGNMAFLLCTFFLVAFTTKMAKIAPLVLFLFCIGVFSQTGYLLIVSLIFGGNVTTIYPLLVLSLKVAVVSLASITVFSGMDPDKLSNGLLYFGFPEQLSFSISFAYRILPILMEEFQNILLSYRLRGKAPNKQGFFGKINYLIYQVKIIILCFYPLILNTAKRSRTTVEALELKGYRYSVINKEVKKIKLAMLKFNKNDAIFAFVSIFYIFMSIIIAVKVG